ncbi:MAG: TauD/TfdA family dioxygenase [Pseudomonadota bacterium]
MPIVQPVTVDGQYDLGGPFPLVLAPEGGAALSASLRWIEAHRTQLLDQVAAHGVVLLRNIGAANAEDFDAVIRAFGLPNFTYADSLSNAVRVNLTERVFTANEAPPDVSIFLHHEMAQTPIFPSRLFFFCEKSAEVAGQTPVCRSDALYDALLERVPDFARRCEALGVKYTNTMPGDDDPESGQGRSWRSTLNVDSAEAAEARLKSLGYSWDWRDDGALTATTPALPAVRTLRDGRKVFFNQLIAAYRGWADLEKSIRFGDDSPMDAAGMAAAVELAESLSFDVPWQAGDVAVVNNFTVMHGRRPFQGTRRVLASLVADEGTAFAA